MESTPCNSHGLKEEGKLGIPGSRPMGVIIHYPEAVTLLTLGHTLDYTLPDFLFFCEFIFLFHYLLYVYIHML